MFIERKLIPAYAVANTKTNTQQKFQTKSNIQIQSVHCFLTKSSQDESNLLCSKLDSFNRHKDGSTQSSHTTNYNAIIFPSIDKCKTIVHQQSKPANSNEWTKPIEQCWRSDELDMRGAAALPPDNRSNHSGGSNETIKIDDVIEYADT